MKNKIFILSVILILFIISGCAEPEVVLPDDDAAPVSEPLILPGDDGQSPGEDDVEAAEETAAGEEPSEEETPDGEPSEEESFYDDPVTEPLTPEPPKHEAAPTPAEIQPTPAEPSEEVQPTPDPVPLPQPLQPPDTPKPSKPETQPTPDPVPLPQPVQPNEPSVSKPETQPVSAPTPPAPPPKSEPPVSVFYPPAQNLLEMDLKEFANAVRPEFYKLINQYRKDKKLRELDENKDLQIYADIRAAELLIYFDHERPDGSEAGSGWYDSKNFINTRYAENAFWSMGYTYDYDPKVVAYEIFAAWKDSSGHNLHMTYDFNSNITMAFGICIDWAEYGTFVVGAIWATGY